MSNLNNNMNINTISGQLPQFNNGQMSTHPGFNPTPIGFNPTTLSTNNPDTSQKKDKKKKNTLKDKINNKSKSSTTYQINIHSNNARSESLSSQSSGSDLNV